MKIEICKLTSHPYNHRIYGYTDNTELTEKIKSSGWIKPILVTKDYMVISGHRRIEVCKTLGISEIECEIVDDDPLKQLELFVSENFYRVKTTTQLMKESEIYFDIEKKKAYQRIMSGVTPETGMTSGRTTEIVAKKIGMGETSYKKGKKVMEYIKDYPEYTWLFENLLDQSIDKSAQTTEKPPEFLDKVIETASGNSEMIIPVIKELEQEEQKSHTPLPPGKYGVILFNLTDRFTGNLLLTDISSICQEDCILCMWVKPNQVSWGLELCTHWKFRYSRCLIWNKDTESDITFNCELLLISVKGSPNIVFKSYESSSEKPLFVENLINKGYPELSKVEIFVGDGWRIW
ncbi:MAG: ParB N-terminal domain-containing protein [Bacteroidota bacterium]